MRTQYALRNPKLNHTGFRIADCGLRARHRLYLLEGCEHLLSDRIDLRPIGDRYFCFRFVHRRIHLRYGSRNLIHARGFVADAGLSPSFGDWTTLSVTGQRVDPS